MSGGWRDTGWPVVRLGEIASLVGGGTPSRKRGEFFAGDVPWLTGQDIPEDSVGEVSRGREFISERAIDGSATHKVAAGTVLITTRVTVGKTAVAAEPLCFSQDVTGIVLRHTGLALPHFLAWFLHAQRPALLQKNQGSTIAGITRPTLAAEQIPLPSLSEQQRIVDLLQEAEAIRRLRHDAESQSAAIIPALFRQMFVEPSTRRGWAFSKVGGFAMDTENSIRTGPFGSDLLHSEFVNEGIPVLGIDNVVSNRFRWDERRFISPGKYAELKRFRVYPGDVLVTIMGTVGRSCVAPSDLPESISTKHLCVITPNTDEVTPEFLSGAFLYDPEVRHQTRAAGRGAIMEGWNSGIIRSLRIRKPPIALQRTFAARVHEALAIENLLPSADRMAMKLQASLLAHGFTGELTTEWREKHAKTLEREARDRDRILNENDAPRGRRATIQEVDAIFERRTDGIHGQLTEEQYVLLEDIQRGYDGKPYADYFTAQDIAPRVRGRLRANPQGIAGHLTVFAARGLLIALSREQADAQTGEVTFGDAYRLPLRDREAREGDPTEPRPGDRNRHREIARLADVIFQNQKV